MHPVKLIGIVIFTGLTAFALLLIYTLTPTIRTVTQHPVFSRLLDKNLLTQKTSYIYHREKGLYDLREYALSERENDPGEKVQVLTPGTVCRIQAIKTYKNSISGFTHLYALGTYTPAGKLPIDFEYDLGYLNVPVGQLDKLPHTPWD